jgi:hypothetical protein
MGFFETTFGKYVFRIVISIPKSNAYKSQLHKFIHEAFR